MPDTSWHALLELLAAAPRENGSAELAATAQRLAELLTEIGWQVHLHSYVAYPYEQRLLGVVLLVSALAYAACMRTHRFGWAMLAPIASVATAVAQIEGGLPLSWLAAHEQSNVVATLAPSGATQWLVLAAHYDTKTDLLDHVARAPIFVLGVPLGVLMLAIAAVSYVGFHAGNFSPGRQTLARVLAWASVLYGIGAFCALSAGMFLGARSHGAIDDGAACAVLVRLAEKLRHDPPQRTAVQLVFFSGEEISAQGSRAWVAQGFDRDHNTAVRVVNFDPLGASTELAILGSERGLVWSYSASPEVVGLLDRAHRRLRRRPIEVIELTGLTDAWPFLRAGLPAATVFSPVPPFAILRSLHSVEDRVERIVPGALDAALRFAEFVVREYDRAPAATP